MAATVGLIKNITEALLGIGEVSIDNFTFQLFYKWCISVSSDHVDDNENMLDIVMN